MSPIVVSANSRDVADVGSLGLYLQRTQSREPLIPPWATKNVRKVTGYGAVAGFAASGAYSLASGLGLTATGANMLFGGVGFGLLGGLAILGYNILKHYKIL